MTLQQHGQREQRRYERIQLSVPARFLADGQERSGAIIDISAGGMALSTDERPTPGSQVIVYVDALGRVEGRVVRHLSTGFAIQFDATDAKRERLVQRLHWLAAGPHSESVRPLAVEEREKPHFVLPDGSEIECKVLDMSVHGVSLQVGIKPAIGSEVSIGRMRGRISSHHQSGVEIEFQR
jgi:hypothetical protein